MNRIWQWAKFHKIYLLQILAFSLAKIFLAVVQLPRYTKTENYLPMLILSALFYIVSFILKLCNIKSFKILEYLFVNLKLFLIWIVTSLVLIFSFSLSHALQWQISEIILVGICLLAQNAILATLCYQRYTSRLEFVMYQLILCINIISLGIKTVLFLQFQANSPFKDLILLNLTTQIALSILLMDSIERSFKIFLEKSVKQLQIQMEQQLTNS